MDYVEHVDFVVAVHAAVDMDLSNEMAVRHSDKQDDVVGVSDIDDTVVHVVMEVVRNCWDTLMVPLDMSYYW
jgi:hypothetical protein